MQALTLHRRSFDSSSLLESNFVPLSAGGTSFEDWRLSSATRLRLKRPLGMVQTICLDHLVSWRLARSVMGSNSCERGRKKRFVGAPGFNPRNRGFGMLSQEFGASPHAFGPTPRRFVASSRGFGPGPRRFGDNPRGFWLSPSGFGTSPLGLHPILENLGHVLEDKS